MTVFGGSALYQAIFQDTGIVEAVNADVSTAIYHLLANYPLAKITSGVAVFTLTGTGPPSIGKAARCGSNRS